MDGGTLWGTADLQEFCTPRDETGQRFPFALSRAIPMNPQIMLNIQNGPNKAYADEYARVNDRINELSEVLAAEIKSRGCRSNPLAASDCTDTVNIKGDFPHKTAATRAGLGWIGRHCQLITSPYGSWVRLGIVATLDFIDLFILVGAIGTFLTAEVYSIWTNWGWFNKLNYHEQVFWVGSLLMLKP
jgi:hypothetical protein